MNSEEQCEDSVKSVTIWFDCLHYTIIALRSCCILIKCMPRKNTAEWAVFVNAVLRNLLCWEPCLYFVGFVALDRVFGDIFTDFGLAVAAFRVAGTRGFLAAGYIVRFCLCVVHFSFS